ncbi:MmcQ/YjbR family DNA-binding protein [Granulicella sp. L60]|uniref:MmcQ/YjbR family DNA-binding protein n=1 Tax=Granulicella sp. L60 TaxID=1641866 RepID=UPI00131CFE36|nr:MmcQ/YjbR family DNA-binding protein [Granulicella sp. L60]
MPKPTQQIVLFRKLALSLEGAVESAHIDHPDFRLNNQIFATLYGQEKGCGVLKLTPEQQQSFLAEQPQVFSPVAGGWGRNGMTYIHLDQADEAVIAGALTTAHHNLQQKQAQKRSPNKKSPAKSTPSKSKKTK